MTETGRTKLLAALVVATLAASLLALLATSRQAEAAFPGTNGRIAFYDNGDIWTINPGAAGPTRLTTNINTEGNPAFSPDGSRIAYEFFSGIWVMDSDGTDQRRLTNGSTLDEDPAWSADGTRIVFARSVGGGRSDIWMMNADGSGPRNLTNTSENSEREPAFSPKGDKIAYTRIGCEVPRGGGMCVYTMNVDGSGQTNLTPEDEIPGCEGSPSYSHDGASENPAWSPDGTQIVFSGSLICPNHIGKDLWVMNAGGGEKTNITNDNNTGDIQPAFSPDGTSIVFVRSNSSLPARMYTIPRTGGTPTLLDDEASVSNPDWSPARPDCTILGTPGDDRGANAIIGTAGDDVICGLGGSDAINGKGGDDIVLGDGGDDTLVDTSGKDTLNGGPGTDTASFAVSATPVRASLVSGFAQRVGTKPLEGVALVAVENLTGSAGADSLTGSRYANTLIGGSGADTLFGLAGNDALNSRDGVAGNDRLDAGTGTDRCTTDAREALVRGCE